MIFDSVIFDFDSTLITGESLDWLGELKGMGPRIRTLTAQAMNGEVPLENVMEYKMKLMNPTLSDMAQIVERTKQSFVPGTKELFEILKNLNKQVYILSSNFHTIIDPAAALLGVPATNVIANTLIFNGSQFHGVDPLSPLMGENGKANVLKEKAASWGKRVFIGDSVSDARATPYIEKFICFGGVVVRPKAQAMTQYTVNDSNLLALIPHILDTSEQ